MTVSASIQVTALEKGTAMQLSLSMAGESQNSFEYLCFSIATPLVDNGLQGGVLMQRTGDWHKVKLTTPATGDDKIKLVLQLVGSIKKATDYPAGMYLESKGHERLEVSVVTPVRRDVVQDQSIQTAEPIFIPNCACELGAGVMPFPKSFGFDSSGWSEAWLQRLLARLAKPLLTSDQSECWLFSGVQQPDMTDAFKLAISLDGAILAYKDREGFFQGQAFLFQFVLQWSVLRHLSPCTLSGTAGFAYRGVHLDVVRHFFAATKIADWLDILALYQYNHFHWHLTDDDGWRVESKAFPQLTEIGAWRGPGLPLPPQMGSGKNIYGGFYTPTDVTDVVARAAEVGITVVPEMDLPGHARALLKSIPELVESDDQSQYRSVQFHNDNVINPAYGATMEVVETLIDEWCDLFPGALFHVGCDEVPKGVWQHSPSAQAWAVTNQKQISDLQGYFLSRIERRLQANGKTMAGWEEVADGGGTSTATWVYSWQGTDAGVRAAQAGHNVVMTPAQYCYFDLAVTNAFESPGYWWAGTVDVRKAYQYKPRQHFSEQEARLIQGVQYCLWSELIESPTQAEFMWFPRLLAGAEVVWESNTNDGFDDFMKRLQVHSVLLSKLGIAVNLEK